MQSHHPNKINMAVVKNYNIFGKHSENRGLYLDEYQHQDLQWAKLLQQGNFDQKVIQIEILI